MPNDERILETMPVGTLGLIPTDSCRELGEKVDAYLKAWRENREHEHQDDIAFKDYYKNTYGSMENSKNAKYYLITLKLRT